MVKPESRISVFALLLIALFMVVIFDSPSFCTDIFPDGTIYVDPESIGGVCDDNNPGTIDEPLCTLRKGLAMLETGGTLILREGIHRVSRDLGAESTISGSAEDYTEILAYPGEKPRIYLSQNVIYRCLINPFF